MNKTKLSRAIREVAADQQARVQMKASSSCTCPNCGHQETHRDRGTPCDEKQCPKCGKPFKGENCAEVKANSKNRKVKAAVHTLYHLIKKGNDFIYKFVKKGSIDDLKSYVEKLDVKWIPKPNELFKGYWRAKDESTYHINPPGVWY